MRQSIHQDHHACALQNDTLMLQPQDTHCIAVLGGDGHWQDSKGSLIEDAEKHAGYVAANSTIYPPCSHHWDIDSQSTPPLQRKH